MTADDRQQADPVMLVQSVTSAFNKFQFQLGEVVVHKTRPKMRWVVLARSLVQDEGGVSREYQIGSLLDGGGTITCGESELELHPGFS